jgi:hypothetical protein
MDRTTESKDSPNSETAYGKEFSTTGKSLPRKMFENGFTVTWPPTDEPWGVREFHLRHPDGHTFRVSAGICEE